VGLADQQKQNAKHRAPTTFVASGIFARWRHPNYAGEIIVQMGLIIAGIAAVSAGWANYAAVTIAPVYVILLMIAECTRSDKYQMSRYGDDDAYKNYVARSGSIVPRW
jgi:steroid 5-alpha reductase family enzyme